MNGHSVTIFSPHPLVRVDVVNAAGTCFLTRKCHGDSTVELPLDTLPHGMLIVVCYGADGSMISKNVCM